MWVRIRLPSLRNGCITGRPDCGDWRHLRRRCVVGTGPECRRVVAPVLFCSEPSPRQGITPRYGSGKHSTIVYYYYSIPPDGPAIALAVACSMSRRSAQQGNPVEAVNVRQEGATNPGEVQAGAAREEERKADGKGV